MRIASLLLLIASPAAAADQFDLVCTGVERTSEVGRGPASARAYQDELRVDLAAKRYCQDTCEATRPIDEVQAGFIGFEPATTKPVFGSPEIHHWVDRKTGKYTDYRLDWQGSMFSVEASCEPAPFKGFPTPAAKF